MINDTTKLIKIIRATPGWRLQRTRRQHWIALGPAGQRVSLGGEHRQSDAKAMIAIVSNLRRAGFPI